MAQSLVLESLNQLEDEWDMPILPVCTVCDSAWLPETICEMNMMS